MLHPRHASGGQGLRHCRPPHHRNSAAFRARGNPHGVPRIQGRRGIIDPLSHPCAAMKEGFRSFEDKRSRRRVVRKPTFSGRGSGAWKTALSLPSVGCSRAPTSPLLERVAAIAGQREFPAGSRISAGSPAMARSFFSNAARSASGAARPWRPPARLHPRPRHEFRAKCSATGKSARSATVPCHTDVCCWILQAAD